MKVFLVDDHAVFREALVALLAARAPGIEIVGECGDGRAALAAIPAAAPDLVVMDVVLGGPNGIATARDLRRVGYRGHVLMLTAVREPSFVAEAFASDVEGYALKDDPAQELLSAIDRVAKGKRYLSPHLERSLLATSTIPIGARRGLVETLSLREREIFNLIVAGYTNQRMANELFISVKTVETHRSRINKKLRVHSTGELIRLAALHGLVSS